MTSPRPCNRAEAVGLQCVGMHRQNGHASFSDSSRLSALRNPTKLNKKTNMRSLLRLLKNKAFSSVNTRKQNDSSSLNRSPFATGSTSVEYINPACAETASCQSDKFNALADLAQRVSSSTEFEVTSAADFLSGSKSMDLEDEHCDEGDYEHILLTPWPFSSFSQRDSDSEMQGNEEGEGAKNGSGKLGTFEFKVPEPAEDDESDKPVSTLFKWGTLDTMKASESQESVFNNSDAHHYDTWSAGEKTPFDRIIDSAPTPFDLREDSAQQKPSTSFAEEEELTLPLLQNAVKRAYPGSILDLGGLHLVAEGSLLISTDDITLQNGTLDLTQGLSVGACRVNLQDLTLISQSSKAATVRVSKKRCRMTRCAITNTEGVGVQVTGMGSTLTMQQTTVHDCERSCVCVNRAGILRMSEGCIIRGSRSFHGIAATDAGTELWIEDSKIVDNFQDGIYVTSSAHAALEQCEISGSRNFHGIAGKKFGTTIVMKKCQLRDCKESGLIVEMGAKAKLTQTAIKKCVQGPGVVADGHGSHVDLLDSEIADCTVGGALIRASATCKFTRTHVFGSAYGNGVVVLGNGSHVHLINSVIFQNCLNGVLVMEEGRATLESCDVSSSTAAHGVFVRDEESQALLDHCQLSKNHSSNLCADAGAQCYAVHCRFDAARNGPSVLVRGRRTTVRLTAEHDAARALQKDLYALSRGKILMNDNRCRNQQTRPKFKQNHVFSHKHFNPFTPLTMWCF